MKDGWYINESSEGWHWEVWDNGKFLLACSDDFKNKMLTHPRIIEGYEKYIKQKSELNEQR